MSTSNPILPPGSPLRRTRSHQNPKLLVTVFAILAVHLVLLAGLLIQGCKREEPRVSAPPENEFDSLPNLSETPFQGERLPPPPPPEPTVSAQTAPGRPLTPPSTLPGAEAPAPGVVAEPGAFGSQKTEPPTPRVRPQDTPPPATAPAGVPTVYVVQAGDTLTRIARNHGTTVNAIRAANGLKTDRILVGQKLKITSNQPAANSTPAR